MKAPDKIYRSYFYDSASEVFQSTPAEDADTCTEYIRKDFLLEWAKNLKEKWEEPPMSRHSPGCVFMLGQLIDKLNSM